MHHKFASNSQQYKKIYKKTYNAKNAFILHNL